MASLSWEHEEEKWYEAQEHIDQLSQTRREACHEPYACTLLLLYAARAVCGVRLSYELRARR